MRNSGNYFGWPVSPAGEVVSGPRGERGFVRFGVHAFRMFAALCLFLAIGMSPAKRALADGGKESLAPKIVQEMQCGSHRVAITCYKAAQNGAICPLKIFDAMGRVTTARGLSRGKRNPESMHCGVGRDGRHYVEVLVSTCIMPSCGVLVMLTEDGHEIASRSALGAEDSAQSRRYDRFMDRNKIRFSKHFGE